MIHLSPAIAEAVIKTINAMTRIFFMVGLLSERY